MKTAIKIIILSAVLFAFTKVFADTTSVSSADSIRAETVELQRSLDEISKQINILGKKINLTSFKDDVLTIKGKLASIGNVIDSFSVKSLTSDDRYQSLIAMRDSLLNATIKLESKIKPEYRKTLQEQNFRIYNLNYFSKMDANKDDIKFQLSNAYKIFKLKFNENYNRVWFPELWLSYTGLSRWALFDFDNSSPFLQTNHMPELFFSFGPGVLEPGRKNPGLTNIKLGVMHESNGQQIDSRSWDRYFCELTFEVLISTSQYINFNIRPWISTEIIELDPKGIEDYLGDGEISVTHIGRNFRAGLSARYATEDIDDNKMMIPFIRRLQADLGWEALSAMLGVFGKEPQKFLWEGSQLYVQYFCGYGQFMTEYDKFSNGITVGIMIKKY
ncbi:phospholipase A [bacterium]|nr:phospholipase A [bacterium]